MVNINSLCNEERIIYQCTNKHFYNNYFYITIKENDHGFNAHIYLSELD